LSHHDAGQQAAVGTTLDAEMPRTRDASRYEILANRDEVIVGSLTIFLERRLMPGRPVLATASNIGHDVRTATL